MTKPKKDIRKLNLQEIEEYLNSVGEKSFRAKQIYEWLWKKNAHKFEDMTNLSKDLRSELDQVFSIDNIRVDLMQKSDDGTIKNAVKLHDEIRLSLYWFQLLQELLLVFLLKWVVVWIVHFVLLQLWREWEI